MKKIPLTHLKTSRRVKVADVLGGANMAARLMNMGVYKGREIAKLSHIGLRGPVVIKSGRTILAVGHGVAAKIIVEI
jgi:ferrous iron transport protein A